MWNGKAKHIPFTIPQPLAVSSPKRMAALWRWQFEYEEYPETWYDPEEYDLHTSTFYPIPVEQLSCYILRRPKTTEVYLENFHAIRYLEIERGYLSLDVFYLKAGKDPPTEWMEHGVN